MTERQIECAACGGEGEIEHPHMPIHHLHSESPEYAIVQCDDCDGTGKVWIDDENSPHNAADQGAGFLDFPAPCHPSTSQEVADRALAADRETRSDQRRALRLNYGRARGL